MIERQDLVEGGRQVDTLLEGAWRVRSVVVARAVHRVPRLGVREDIVRVHERDDQRPRLSGCDCGSGEKLDSFLGDTAIMVCAPATEMIRIGVLARVRRNPPLEAESCHVLACRITTLDAFAQMPFPPVLDVVAGRRQQLCHVLFGDLQLWLGG